MSEGKYAKVRKKNILRKWTSLVVLSLRMRLVHVRSKNKVSVSEKK